MMTKLTRLSQNGMKYKDSAEKYGMSLNTVKSWKRHNKRIREKGAPIGNQNAKGHVPPKGNQKATKFRFFSKYLPSESVEIMQEINVANPSDLFVGSDHDSVHSDYTGNENYAN